MGSAFWKFWNKDGGGRDDCESVESRLEEYAGGAMPESEERARIASHLTQCPRCRAAAAEYERTNLAWAAFGAVAAPESPGDWASVRAKLQAVPLPSERSRRGVPFLSGRSLAAAALAVAAGAMAVLLPSPYRSGNAVAQANGNGEAMNASRSIPESVTANGGDLTVTPAFVNLVTDETFPIVATLTNAGAAADAQFTVVVFGGGDPRVYNKTARLPANQKSKVFLYPRIGPASERGTPSLSFHVTLHGKTQTALLPFNSGINRDAIGYIGKNLAALSPKFYQDHPQTQMAYLSGVYVKPENAPDRAVGYSGLHSLVISQEGTELNAAQWNAIREWVKSGGSVFLMGGGGNPLLATPEGAEMAPVRLAHSSSAKPFALKDFAPDDEQFAPDYDRTIHDAFSPTRAEKLDLKPGAKLRENIVSTAPGLPIANVMWRSLGAGAVVYTDFDATAEPLREWNHYNELWVRLTNLEGVTRGQGMMLRDAARLRYAPSVSGGDGYDPFHLALPSLQSVVYCFLTYFVLVVPVTFVALKHTRRLHLAWFTGPALAVLFAAGIYLLTAGLYFMPTARRTTGIVTLASGDPNGRFGGFTEFFFPRAGTYKIAIPGAELLEEQLTMNDKGRGLSTTEDAAGVLTAPQVGVNNMAFRRLYHEQRVTLAGGVTATLNIQADGDATVNLHNRTGETLRDALIITSRRVALDARHPNWLSWETLSYPLGDVAPGASRRDIARKGVTIGVGQNSPAGRYLAYSYPFNNQMDTVTVVPHRTTLMARLDAARFGPQFGKDYSAPDSVTVVVGLDDNAVETAPARPERYMVMSDGQMKKAIIASNGKIEVGGTPEKDAILLPPAIAAGMGGYSGPPPPYPTGGYGGPAPVAAGGYGGGYPAPPGVAGAAPAKAAMAAKAVQTVETGGAK